MPNMRAKQMCIIAISVAAITILGIGTNNVYAHQRNLFTIGDKDYLIVIGSQNEPVFVDDKTGVDLYVYSPDPSDPTNSQAKNVQPVNGLEQTLKVEIAAGDKKKTMNLTPAYGSPGHYNAPFYPTIQTTFSYRIFGTVNSNPVDLTFTCDPTGEGKGRANNATVRISDYVTQKYVAGAFGCPEDKVQTGFPEPFITDNQISTTLNQIQSDVSSLKSSSSNAGQFPMADNTLAYGGLGTGIAGIIIAGIAISIAKRKS